MYWIRTTFDEDPADSDTTVDDVIGVTLNPGEDDDGNDFVDTNMGSISGSVKCETGDDNVIPLSGVTIELLDLDGVTVLETITTDEVGNYKFPAVSPGVYFVNETNLEECPKNVKDQDTTDDGDTFDSDSTVDNLIGVEVEAGEEDDGNDFIDTNKGSISGTVTCRSEDAAGPLSGVKVELIGEDGVTVVASTTTDENGFYVFPDIPPGVYFVNEINSEECANDVSDQDMTGDGDSFDRDTTVDNLIGVELNPGEDDDGNDFVDGNAVPSESPTTSPAPSDLPSRSPITLAPSSAPSEGTPAPVAGGAQAAPTLAPIEASEMPSSQPVAGALLPPTKTTECRCEFPGENVYPSPHDYASTYYGEGLEVPYNYYEFSSLSILDVDLGSGNAKKNGDTAIASTKVKKVKDSTVTVEAAKVKTAKQKKVENGGTLNIDVGGVLNAPDSITVSDPIEIEFEVDPRTGQLILPHYHTACRNVKFVCEDKEPVWECPTDDIDKLPGFLPADEMFDATIDFDEPNLAGGYPFIINTFGSGKVKGSKVKKDGDVVAASTKVKKVKEDGSVLTVEAAKVKTAKVKTAKTKAA